MLYLSAILTIVAGCILLFSGWRTFKGLATLFGIIIGGICGAAAMAIFSPSFILTIAGIVVGAIIGALLFHLASFIAFPILGGIVGVMIAQMLFPNAYSGFIYWLVVIVFAAIGAVMGLVLRRIAVIATTSLIGAGMVVGGVMQIMNGTSPMEPFKTGQMDSMPMIAIFAVALVGAVIQLSGKRKDDKK